ncbi:flavodoxin domain-containing protein [Corynebacterium mastitidis]|uniref:Flavodoxin domain-containing protein n=1 Tax=Corynebacterium mastitidis TaxID=161890 RepID=A0A2N0X914_9CORY|nr:flavodoxin domain-containing protein [Corynebacterium mastitidis]MCH6196418.1 flavodoxin domain-containing protein [Corynebacterium mastitidis]PKF69192.1 hypothetical protein CXB45_03390 [Corynebacterium mastitidis]
MTQVLYQSTYGATRRYAEALARRLGTTAEPLDDPARPPGPGDAADAGPLVVLSPVLGPTIAAASYAARHDLGGRPVACVAVGMTLVEEARRKDQMAGILGDKAPRVSRFYLPGALYYSRLSTAHRQILRGIVGALRLKPGKSENERAMIRAYNKDVDRVDLGELEPIVEWAKSFSA